MTYNIECADILAWAASYDGPKFHAILCDPPYNLTQPNIRNSYNPTPGLSSWDAVDEARKQARNGSNAGGFMGKKWDSAIAFRPDTWAALAEHLHDGGFVMAFGGARTWHRLAVAMEDAGLRIHPSIFCWTYGSGFPKATRLDTQHARQRGVVPCWKGKAISNDAMVNLPYRERLVWHWHEKVTKGHRYGLQALKPAAETLVIAHKPLTIEPIYGIISQINLLVEVVLCSLLPVPDAEPLISQIHQSHRAVVEHSAQGSADVWALLENVRIAGDRSVSNLAGSTLRDFAVGPALTKDETLPLVQTILTGLGECSSPKDTDISEAARDTLQSIGWLWNSILAELLNRGSTFITSTATHWTIDLRILQSYLSQIIVASTTRDEHTGLPSLALIAESLLRSASIKLQSLSCTTATETAIEPLAPLETDRVGGEIQPVIVAQKPYSGKPVDCITATGAGALWVDGGRIGTEEVAREGGIKNPHPSQGCYGDFAGNVRRTKGNGANSPSGRWPANFALVHAPGCRRVGTARVRQQSGSVRGTEPSHTGDENTACYGEYDRVPFHRYADADGLETIAAWDCTSDCPARRLGEQSGVSGPGKWMRTDGARPFNNDGKPTDAREWQQMTDTGTAARFFYQASWQHEVAEQLAAADTVRYQAKAARSERDAGLDAIEPLRMRYSDRRGNSHDIFNTEGNGRNTDNRPVRNIHPTCKPIDLIRWLATLLLPPAEYAPRRVLVPFAGSGSEMIGCGLAGWDEIVGVELMPEYAEIAEARLAHWLQNVQLELIPQLP